MENYSHFVAIVAGENPIDLIDKHKNNENELFIAYRYDDAEEIKRTHTLLAKEYLKQATNEFEQMDLEDIIETLENQTIDEFWDDLSEEYEVDENKNLYTHGNPDAKFSSYNMGKNLSLPFTLKDGTTSFQARKGDIDWNKMHLHEYDMYIRTWELAMEGETPLNDIEKKIKKNMGNMREYFMFFGDKETYASHCSAFWGYAFLNEDGQWSDLSFEISQIDWVLNYYKKFIEPLPDNMLLTVFECRK